MSDQLKNMLAQILTGLGAYFVGRGWITADLLTGTIVPALITLIGLGYSVYLNTRGAKVAAVAAVPGTEVVLPRAEATLAAKMPENVTSK